MTLEYEYGIRHKKSGEIHREKMTLDEAQCWMRDDWGDAKPYNVFEIVCRRINDWHPIVAPME